MTPSTAQGQGKPKGSTGQSRGGKSSPSTDRSSAGSRATSSPAATVALTGTGNTKASAAPPKLSVNGTSVELDSLPGVSGSEPLKPPLEEDIMQLARLGETVMIQKLFDSGKFDAKYKDEEDITPLHWAAINNQYATCRFLLDAGADVNAKGGQSMATPAMWAAQQNHYYVVHLLLQRGGDPSICDIQGYNILHLATFSGNAYLLILLLHQEIPIDVPDPQGHTPLMWAAYKGFPLCVDLFLRWGANVNAVDDGGLTPLHWSLVRGSLPCISKMLDYDADRFAKTKDGKSPATVASEIGTRNLWHRALKDHGYTPQGEPTRLPFRLESFVRNTTYVRKWFFLWPFLMIFGGIYLVSSLPVYLGVPATFFWAFIMQLAAQKVGSAASPGFRDVQKTPFLAGVFAASLFWVVLRWVTTVLPGSYEVYPLTNLMFLLFGGTTSYFFIASMLADPGFVPKLSSRNQQREIMESLLDNWSFDDQHFCVICLNRKPLRSKHCKRCRRCVSKHDHHCPWIDNCVGVNNLRHFVIYILTLEVAILLFLRLVTAYISLLPPATDAQCTLLSASLCAVFSRDSFSIVLGFWAALQLVWVTLLCGVQLVQISRNQTTYEIMRSRHYHPNTPSQAIASAIAAGTTSADATTGQGGPLPPGTATTDDVHIHRHGHSHKGCCSSLRLLLGIDTFMVTATGQDERVNKNPFSQGCFTNCKDFWFDGTPVLSYKATGHARLAGRDVNYHQMFDVPYNGRSGDSMMVYRSLRGDDVV